MHIPLSNVRGWALVFGCCIYGAFGSPTPEAFGLVEFIVGLCLVAAIGANGVLRVFKFSTDTPLWFQAGQVLLFYGLIAGIGGGLLQGHDLRLLIRDAIPFLFMALPLFLYQSGDARMRAFLLAGVLIIGFGFAVRASADVLPFDLRLDGNALYYLGNSPAVLFTALSCIGLGVSRLGEGFDFGHMTKALLLFALAGIVIVPLVLSLQRASLGAAALYGVLAMGVVLLRTPRRGIVIVMIAAGVFVLNADIFLNIFGSLENKTALVGVNMRAQEWQAVWGEVSVSLPQFLCGNGFGASFSSPAVADIRVNYTHSLLGAMLLKLGAAGLLFTVFYTLTLGVEILRGLKAQPLLALALAAPLVIDVFLYAAYKSLDFGLFLAVIAAMRVSGPSVASHRPVMYLKTASHS